MTDVSWSRCGGQDCVRLRGLASATEVQVRSHAAVVVDDLPPMAGRLVRDGGDICFVPRYPFIDGTAYTVLVGGVPTTVLVRPQDVAAATTEVLDILPTSPEVPRNLLRLYVWFSAPMSEGYAARHLRLVDDAGDAMLGTLLPTEHELWDSAHRRLTVLLDPARIKRGLLTHRQIDYPLRYGASFRFVADDGFRDARGLRLRAGAQRQYTVGDEERRRIEPDLWVLTIPSSHTFEPLDVMFERPLDHGLLGRCLRIVGPDGGRVDGTPQVGREGRSWRLAPRRAWAPVSHRLVVDPVLEDLAGNSLTRVFDRDLTRPEDEPHQGGATMLTFRPR